MKKRRTVTVYMFAENYRKLRAKLILQGKTVSSWFREKVAELLEEGE